MTATVSETHFILYIRVFSFTGCKNLGLSLSCFMKFEFHLYHSGFFGLCETLQKAYSKWCRRQNMFKDTFPIIAYFSSDNTSPDHVSNMSKSCT